MRAVALYKLYEMEFLHRLLGIFSEFVESYEKYFAEVAAEHLKALNTNAFAVENSNGLAADAVRSVLRGKSRGANLARAKEISDALGLEFYIGLPRDLPPTDPASLPPLEPGGDLVQIRLHDQQFAAGDGASVAEAEGVMSSMAFPAPWLHHMGLTARSAALVWVNGDSMEPTLKSGAMAMLDTRITDASKRSIYAFRNGKDLFVKRLERIGKVVWSGRRIRDQIKG